MDLTRRTALGFISGGTAAGLLTAAARPPDVAAEKPNDSGTLTNLSHLEFLLDEVPLEHSSAHSTYGIADSPVVRAPWTYCELEDDGSYRRVGGGDLDEQTGHYTQGAYNADDTSRAAVVFIRHWLATKSKRSRTNAYEVLRALAFHQRLDGPNAGNVVLWQQSDGSLNPSALPIELPDPSDSDESYWLARTVWALGEGYAAFAAAGAKYAGFAEFLRDRMHLALAALERASLGRYETWEQSDGVAVPGWLIANGADASAEAIFGLAAFVRAAPQDSLVRSALEKYAHGVAQMGRGGVGQWPFGAILPWAPSGSFWHAWGSMTPAALGACADLVAGDSLSAELLQAAVPDIGSFTPQLLTSGGPFNAWSPVPGESQIAYGADCRVAGALAVSEALADADAGDGEGLRLLAGLAGGWFFGANPAGTAVYDPDTGVTFDGVEPSGTINRNSGAESTIHGQLAMIALDAQPDLAALASAITGHTYNGLRVLEAEDGELGGGAQIVEPESAWTGEANISGGAYVQVPDGGSVRIDHDGTECVIHVILTQRPDASGELVIRAIDDDGGSSELGRLRNRGADPQGISENSGALLPLPVRRRVPAGTRWLEAVAEGGTGAHGTAQFDAILVQPLVATADYATLDGGHVVLYANATRRARQVAPLRTGGGYTYAMDGRRRTATARRKVLVAGSGFSITGA